MTTVEQPRYWFPKPYADLAQRLRVVAGFLLLVTFAFFAQPNPKSLVMGVLVSLLGLALRGWAAGHLSKNEDLATSGPYAYIRNPLYAGTLLVAAGVVIACRSFMLALIAAIVFLLVYLPAIELEEQHLRKIFPLYGSYAEQVHRLWPTRHWKAGTGSFSWALYAKNKEHKAALGFAVALLWMVWRCWMNTTVR